MRPRILNRGVGATRLLYPDEADQITRAVAEGRQALGHLLGMLALAKTDGVLYEASDVAEPAMQLAHALCSIEQCVDVLAKAPESPAVAAE
jgi:hypothetical protein